MAACLCIYSSSMIRRSHPKSEPRTLKFSGKSLNCPLWLQQAELEVWVPSPQPQPPATGPAGERWVAATVLKAKHHDYYLKLMSQVFPWKLQVLQLTPVFQNRHFKFLLVQLSR